MGQQQLLLIVLGVIIVGIAIIVGINLFEAYERQGSIDNLAMEVMSYATMAQQYFKKPQTFGGGGGKFYGWTFPKTNQTLTPSNVFITCTSGTYIYSATVFEYPSWDPPHIKIVAKDDVYKRVNLRTKNPLEFNIMVFVFPSKIEMSVYDNLIE